jgi:hypothetical protein
MAITPAARSLALLRAEGFVAAIVERWNPFGRVRQDLLGCIDVVAVRIDRNGVLGIQATTADNAAARIKKAVALPQLLVWLAAGNGFEVWAWAKRKGRWVCSRRPVAIEDVGVTAGMGLGI